MDVYVPGINLVRDHPGFVLEQGLSIYLELTKQANRPQRFVFLYPPELESQTCATIILLHGC